MTTSVISEHTLEDAQNLAGMIRAQTCIEDATYVLIPRLVAERALGVREGLEFLTATKSAIRALLVMSETAKPAKLDAALSWRENDELARSMCKDVLAAIDARLSAIKGGEG